MATLNTGRNAGLYSDSFSIRKPYRSPYIIPDNESDYKDTGMSGISQNDGLYSDSFSIRKPYRSPYIIHDNESDYKDTAISGISQNAASEALYNNLLNKGNDQIPEVVSIKQQEDALKRDLQVINEKIASLEEEIAYQEILKKRESELVGDPLYEAAKENYIRTGDMGELNNILGRKIAKETLEAQRAEAVAERSRAKSEADERAAKAEAAARKQEQKEAKEKAFQLEPDVKLKYTNALANHSNPEAVAAANSAIRQYNAYLKKSGETDPDMFYNEIEAPTEEELKRQQQEKFRKEAEKLKHEVVYKHTFAKSNPYDAKAVAEANSAISQYNDLLEKSGETDETKFYKELETPKSSKYYSDQESELKRLESEAVLVDNKNLKTFISDIDKKEKEYLKELTNTESELNKHEYNDLIKMLNNIRKIARDAAEAARLAARSKKNDAKADADEAKKDAEDKAKKSAEDDLKNYKEAYDSNPKEANIKFKKAHPGYKLSKVNGKTTVVEDK